MQAIADSYRYLASILAKYEWIWAAFTRTPIHPFHQCSTLVICARSCLVRRRPHSSYSFDVGLYCSFVFAVNEAPFSRMSQTHSELLCRQISDSRLKITSLPLIKIQKYSISKRQSNKWSSSVCFACKNPLYQLIPSTNWSFWRMWLTSLHYYYIIVIIIQCIVREPYYYYYWFLTNFILHCYWLKLFFSSAKNLTPLSH